MEGRNEGSVKDDDDDDDDDDEKAINKRHLRTFERTTD